MRSLLKGFSMFAKIDFASGLVTFESLPFHEQLFTQEKLANALAISTANAVKEINKLKPSSQNKLIQVIAADNLDSKGIKQVFKDVVSAENLATQQARAVEAKKAAAAKAN